MFLPFKRLADIISVSFHEWPASLSLISLCYMLKHIKRVSLAYMGSLKMKGRSDPTSQNSGLKEKNMVSSLLVVNARFLDIKIPGACRMSMPTSFEKRVRHQISG